MRPYGLWMSIWAVVVGLLVADRVQAGYISLNMTTPRQCGVAKIQWWGDDGPYHVLLTPTEFVEHGYNVWIPSVENGTTSYDVTLRQPAGMQFILTVWGASGIQFAGTTDVLTVGQPEAGATSCFLTDEEILDQYTFSFNISDTSSGYPAQCSNLSLSWPTSLESNVTGTVDRRDFTANISALLEEAWDDDPTLVQLDSSSSKDAGNTTKPPTMFGVIPLGNSFEIPITFARSSKFAKYLPESSLSDTPTTHTSDGVAYLEWTVDLAKGTRFILVAGIGAEEQWASGGSSIMLTVGQGSTDCSGNEAGSGGVPSVTATGTASTTAVPTASADSDDSGHENRLSLIGTILACVFSILATLLVVGICFFCRRRIRRRRAAQSQAAGSFASPNKHRSSAYDEDRQGTPETQLDLIASRDAESTGRGLAPLITHAARQPESPSTLTPTLYDPFGDASARTQGFAAPTRTATFDDTASSPVSPVHEPSYSRDVPQRQSSQDLLLPRLPRVASPFDGSYPSSRGPLRLHDGPLRARGGDDGDNDVDVDEDGDGDGDDVTELKRDILTMGDGTTSRSSTSGTSVSAGTGQRTQRRRQGAPRDVEYVVHYDAGRVAQPSSSARVERVELPPRYDELNWAEGEQEEHERATR